MVNSWLRLLMRNLFMESYWEIVREQTVWRDYDEE